MGEVNVKINGRNYGISCQDGQEQRVLDLGHYVDERVKTISAAGAASNENHLMVLTALMLCDEIFDLREGGAGVASSTHQAEHINVSTISSEDEAHMAHAINHLAERIDTLAKRIQSV